MKNSVFSDKPYLPWLIAWTIINFLQAAFTELWNDEALYWVFSQNLAWGFWDHPPMTPLLIHLGYELFANEFGVRFFIVLINTATLYFLYRITRPDKVRLFFIMVFGAAIVHAGWMAAPDLSLLFFASLFLFLYQKYDAADSYQTAGLLGLAVAGMAYSKYHGALVVLFALLGNLKLLRRPSFYLIPLIAAASLIPHFVWQYEHDFPTFMYHFVDRKKDIYQFKFIGDYLLGQIAVFGPFLTLPLLYFSWKYPTKSGFERSLKFILFGILAFFFYQSFTQRTEANWTATAFLPLIYLSYQYIREKENRAKTERLMYRLALPTIALVCILRVFLVWNFLPEGMNPRNEFHGWDVWAQDISEVAGDRPVLFYNGFQDPSKYRFYAQKPAISISVYHHVGTQYELLYDDAAAMQGDTVVCISPYFWENKFKPGGFEEKGIKIFENFRSYNSIKVKLAEDFPEVLPADTTMQVPIIVCNPTEYDYDFFGNPAHPAQLLYHVYVNEPKVLDGVALPEMPVKIIRAGASFETMATMETPKEPGKYRWRFSIDVKDFHNGRNMSYVDFRVE